MDASLFWTLVIYLIDVPIIGFMVLAIALSVSLLSDALRNGATFAIEPSRSIKRTQRPLRYWLYVVGHILFVAIVACAIYLILVIGDFRDI